MCPDSRRFIEKLAKQYDLVKDIVNIKFVPFGKAYVSTAKGSSRLPVGINLQTKNCRFND